MTTSFDLKLSVVGYNPVPVAYPNSYAVVHTKSEKDLSTFADFVKRFLAGKTCYNLADVAILPDNGSFSFESITIAGKAGSLFPRAPALYRVENLSEMGLEYGAALAKCVFFNFPITAQSLAFHLYKLVSCSEGTSGLLCVDVVLNSTEKFRYCPSYLDIATPLGFKP